MKKKILLLLTCLTTISLKCADESKDTIPGLNIKQAAELLLQRTDDSLKKATLQQLIDRQRWDKIKKRLPKDLLTEHQTYLEATKVDHSK